MSRFFTEQTNFNAGIYDELLAGFSDAPRRRSAVKDSLNMIPMVQGGSIRRGGSQFIAEVKFSDKNTFFLKFKSGDTQAYVVEIGDLYMRFYKNRAQLESAPSVPVEIVTPYPAADFFDVNGLFKFQFKQSADVMYIVHEDHQVRVLKRTNDTTWALDIMAFDEFPYLDENATDTTMQAGATTDVGNVTITASSIVGINGGTGFRPSDVGRGIRILKTGQQQAWGIITARASTTVITVFIDDDSAGILKDKPTKRWRLGLYNTDDGFPSVIGLHNQRVVLAGQPAHPDRVALSATGCFSDVSFDFSPSNNLGEVFADDAIQVRVQNGELNFVEWISNLNTGLLIGTTY